MVTERIIEQVIDQELKFALTIYTIPYNKEEERVEGEMLFKKKLLQYFREGKLWLRFNPEKKSFECYPTVMSLMRKEGMI